MVIDDAPMVIDHVPMVIDHVPMVVDHAQMVIDHALMVIDHAPRVIDDVLMVIDHVPMVVDDGNALGTHHQQIATAMADPTLDPVWLRPPLSARTHQTTTKSHNMRLGANRTNAAGASHATGSPVRVRPGLPTRNGVRVPSRARVSHEAL